jgi:predicted SAM-dependent methyltransferase
VLEHFTQPDGLKIAREVHRVLKNGAVFRIVVPDGEKIVRLYVEDPKALTDYRDGNAMEVVNSFFHQRYEHQFIYDFDAISAMLKKAGFSTVTKVGLLKSSNPDLLLDEPAYEWESLYVEATKGSQVDVH